MSYPPCHGDLTDKALTYLKQCHPAEYRHKTIPQRNQYAEDAARRAERYAEILISQGMFESEAWNDAIRTEILENRGD
jgi:hypothetical protein